MKHLVKRRKEIAAAWKAEEGVEASSFSPKHAQTRAMLDEGRKKYSERPVAFICDDRICLLPEDAKAVVAVLKKFPDTLKKVKEAERSPLQKHAVKMCERAQKSLTDGGLELPTQDWNGCLYALNELGCDVVLADGGDDA